MALQSFQLGAPYRYLSFTAEILAIDTNGATFNLLVDSGVTRLKFIAFNIIVVTFNIYEI